MPAPDEESPQRALLAALGAMAGVAVLVGLAVGGVILSVVKLAGLGEDGAGASEAAPESLVLPEYSPTEAGEDDLGLPSVTPTRPSASATGPTKAPEQRIRLSVTPAQVAPGQQIDLRGSYPGGAGAELQVQRKEGAGWVDFPVTASVDGGTFSTYIITSRTGRSPFRVVDKAADERSNVVVVTVG
jgi:hypothetical protein